MMRVFGLGAVGSCVVALLSGCGAQATPDYYGESLASVEGLVSNPESLDISGARVIANWGQAGAMFGSARTHADVQGSFPASFSLDFYEVPPEELLFTPADEVYGDTGPTIDARNFSGTRAQLAAVRREYYDPAHESRIAIARVLAVREDAAQEHLVGAVIGGDEAHVIVYLESDIQAGSYGEALLHGRHKAGYHLFRLSRPDEDAVWRVLECQSKSESLEAWKACGLESPLQPANDDKLNVRLVESDSELTLPVTWPQWVRQGVPVQRPGMIMCNPEDPMAPFIETCPH